MGVVKDFALVRNCIFLIALLGATMFANAQKTESTDTNPENDTIVIKPTIGIDPIRLGTRFNGKPFNLVPLKVVDKLPYTSLQQMLKGNLAGVVVQEPTGEPGTDQNIFIHGLSAPLLNKKYLYDQQAAVYLNGLPLLRDNPFAYDVQKYDFNRIGPATNLLSIINADNIKSIEVFKDPISLASLGPIAANGAIWITTKEGSTLDVSINSYYGIVPAHRVTATNATYENEF